MAAKTPAKRKTPAKKKTPAKSKTKTPAKPATRPAMSDYDTWSEFMTALAAYKKGEAS